MSAFIMPTTWPAVDHIVENIRQCDAEQIGLLRYDGCRLLAADVMGTRWGWVAGIEGVPIATWQGFERSPRNWELCLFATDRWPEVAGTVYKELKRRTFPLLRALGANRAVAYAIASREVERRWMRHLGAIDGKVLHGMGHDGTDYRMFEWIFDHERT